MNSPYLGVDPLEGGVSKKARTTDDFDDVDYSVSELLVELEWNPLVNKRVQRNEDATHAPALCRALGDLMRQGHFCDLTILVENGVLIPVHSCIMAAVSPVLHAKLVRASPPIQVLQLNSLSALTELQKRALCDELTTRNLLTTFAYYGTLDLPKDPVMDGGLNFIDAPIEGSGTKRAVYLLAAAMALQVSGAIVIVLEYLKQLLDVTSCLSIFVAATELGCAELEIAAQEYIDINFSKVVLEQSWVDAPETIIRKVLCRNELCARDEVEVFRAMARWCDEDLEKRGMTFKSMISDSTICRLYLLQDEDIAELMFHDLVIMQDSVKSALGAELDRRRAGMSLPAVQVSRRFAPPQMFPEVQSTSIDLPAMMPQSPSRTRGRSASVVLAQNEAQSRPDNYVSNVTILSGHEKAVCALTSNDQWLASGSSDHSIRVWEMRTWKGDNVLRGHSDSVSALRFIHDHLISGSFDRSIRMWNTTTWRFTGFVAEVAHEDPVTCLTVVTKTDQLASGSAGGEIKIWSHVVASNGALGEWRAMYMLQNAHAHVLWSCCEWGSAIVSGSSDKEIRVWDSTTWTLKSRFTNHKDEVQALVVIGDELYSGSDDGVIAVHSSTDQAAGPTRFVELHRPVMALAEYQSLLAVGFGDGGILLLNRTDLSKFGELKGHAASVMSLVTRSELLISGSFDKTVRVWEYHEKALQ